MLVSWQQPLRKIDSDHNLADESWNKPLFVDYFTRSCRCQRHSIYDAFTEDYSFAAQCGKENTITVKTRSSSGKHVHPRELLLTHPPNLDLS